jgi:hypothetical protein
VRDFERFAMIPVVTGYSFPASTTTAGNEKIVVPKALKKLPLVTVVHRVPSEFVEVSVFY